MIIRKDKNYKPKGWFETWIDDLSFPEKLITIAWCGMPYIIWLMMGDLLIWYKIIGSIGIWLLLTLLCYLFGHFMGSGDRDWNY